MPELDLADHGPHQALLAQYPAFLTEQWLTGIIQGFEPIEMIDAQMEMVTETARHIRQRDIDSAEGVDGRVYAGKIDPGVVVDLDMSQVFHRAYEQIWAAELQRVLELCPAMPGNGDDGLRRDRHYAARVSRGIHVQQHDQPTAGVLWHRMGAGRANASARDQHSHRAAVARRGGRRIEPGEFHRDPLDAVGQVVDVGVTAGRDRADQHHERGHRHERNAQFAPPAPGRLVLFRACALPRADDNPVIRSIPAGHIGHDCLSPFLWPRTMAVPARRGHSMLPNWAAVQD